MELNEPRVAAFIDLGTNSARLLVVKLNQNCSYTVLTRQKEVVRLGEGEFSSNTLTDEAIERTSLVIARFTEIARTFQAGDIVAVATSATRDAINRDALISRIRDLAGIEIHAISGPEEARLIWLGISSGVDIGENTSLFIDIGGGSTEVIVGNQEHANLLRSLKLGAIRTTHMFMPDLTGPVPGQVIQAVRKHIRSRASHTIRHVKNHRISQAFGSSGTIISLEAVAASMKELSATHRTGVITCDELAAVARYLCSLPLSDRRKVQGLNPDRADIIVAGCLILESLLTLAGVPEILVSQRSLRDGLLVDYLSRIPGFPHAEPMPVRESSIRLLGRSCQIDELHAGHVRYLALSLFDSAKESGLHALSDEARDILSFAAYLHDVGQFISFSGHHQHSFYMIMHAPLLGFNDQEILMIALVARYHRKKMPRQKDTGYNLLDPQSRVIIAILAQFLRMAENLDRSHDGRVSSVSLSSPDRLKVEMMIACSADCTLERWAILDDAGSFERTFKKELLIEECSRGEPGLPGVQKG